MATTFSDQNTMQSCLNNFYQFDSDDTFWNDVLQLKSDSLIHNCCCCSGSVLATSWCRDCCEYLCDSCVRIHLRGRSIQDHCILRLSGSPVALSPFLQEHSPKGSTLCDHHPDLGVKFFCDTCCVSICYECTIGLHQGHAFLYLQDAIDSSRSASIKLLSDSKIGAQAVKEGLEMTQKMIEAVNMKAHSVTRDIHVVVAKFQAAINERETELLNKVENIRKIKSQVLIKQAEGLRTALTRFTVTTEQLSKALEIGSPMDLLYAKVQAMQDLKHLTRSVRIGLNPQEDDCITFVVPEFSTLLRYCAAFGDINSTTFSPCNLSEGFNKGRSRMISNKICIDDLPHDPCTNYIGSSENGLLTPELDDRRDSGFLPYRFIADAFPVNNNALGPVNSLNHPFPHKQVNFNLFPACIYSAKKYNISTVSLTFGKEGDGDGELCRPWGVCCDREGNIIVADRSNNRIQIFKSDGSFLRKFGKHGNEPGQFDRPAGVATNRLGHIVVADKDNHRIQIFKSDGQFLFTFGDKGSKNGQFNYPWDVDVNTDGCIVVSDTRNHRIQLFAADGSFLSKYGFENASGMWKHFDSPRGVCFTPNSSIVVTDFNNHRLIVIEHNCLHARFLGAEGSGTKQFLRPQGIAVDCDGHLIVADSRNNRIQVFETSGSFLWQFGTAGKDRGQLDRPSGVCISPDGKIVVVDFGNNRIQVFQ